MATIYRLHRRGNDGKHLCGFLGTVQAAVAGRCRCGAKVQHPRVDEAPKHWVEAKGAVTLDNPAFPGWKGMGKD